MIYLVAALLSVLAVFVFRDMRHRDVWTHRYSSGEAALAMAQGGVSTVLFAIRNAIQPVSLIGDVNKDTLFAFLLQDPGAIRLAQDRVSSRGGDFTEFILQSCGATALDPIRRVLMRYPGAKLRLFLRIVPMPLHVTLSVGKQDVNDKFRDPVEKEVKLRVVATVAYGGATRTAWTEKAIRVYSTLIPLTPRFTAYVKDGGPDGQVANEYLSDRSGAPVTDGDLGPTVLYNNGEHVDPTSKVPQPPSPGLLFFGTNPTIFKLTAGGGQWKGEDFHLSQEGGPPRAFAVDNPPPAIAAARPHDPDHSDEEQALMIQGAFWGYHQGMNFLALFGRDGFDERSSRLHLFGDQDLPSPTQAIGRVLQGLAMYTDLAIDRDATGKDEDEQRKACARDLPVRESVDPFLKRVTSSEYSTDTTRESAGQPTTSLIPFNSPGLPPWSVVNQNYRCDGAVLPSEVGRETIRLDPATYQYSLLFGTFELYNSWACREVQVAANEVPELMQRPAAESFQLLARALLPFKSNPAFADKLADVVKFQLAYTDPLHLSMPPGDGDRLHFDNSRVPDELMSKFDPTQLARDRVVLRMSAKEFLARHIAREPQCGMKLIMGGRAIEVVGELDFPWPVQVVDGGLLVADRVRFEAGLKQPSPLTRLSIVASSLELLPRTSVEAAIWCVDPGKAKGVTFTGSLGTHTLKDLTEWQGCRIVYDGRYDPTGPSAHEAYRESMSDTDFGGGTSYRDGSEVGYP
ncbi:MAG: hypothetical protein HY303_19330 [Candidatus Wallbacteria bacterium]|nr:hypothetical protein [Candidatus Wallbacteria bacterium]